jgi:hypothetical protein
MSELGKRGNLGVVNGVVKTAYADGEGGLIIKTETQLDDFIDHTKAQYNQRSEKTGWGDSPLDAKNKIASLPLEIIETLNVMGIMRGFYITDQKALKKWLNNPDNKVFRTRGGQV